MTAKTDEATNEAIDNELEDQYDRFVEECSDDLDERLNEMFERLKREKTSSIFTDERKFWRAVMSRAEMKVSVMSDIPNQLTR